MSGNPATNAVRLKMRKLLMAGAAVVLLGAGYVAGSHVWADPPPKPQPAPIVQTGNPQLDNLLNSMHFKIDCSDQQPNCKFNFHMNYNEGT